MNVVTGAHLFRLQLEDPDLVFIHSSPGTGTRQTRADVSSIRDFLFSAPLFVAFTWSPEELSVHVGVQESGGELIRSGATTDRLPRIWVDTAGGVIEVGSPDVAVMGVRVLIGGREIVSPPARELWADTRTWAEVLVGLNAEASFADQVAVANAAFICLVSGLEVYLQTRFVELEGEGIPPDVGALERRLGERVVWAAQQSGEPFAVAFAERVSFQSYDRAKDAYSAGYGVRFGEDLGLASSDLARLQRLLKYRHRIIHQEPMASLLNATFAGEEPEFSGRDFVARAEAELAAFIDALHTATLRLRPA